MAGAGGYGASFLPFWQFCRKNERGGGIALRLHTRESNLVAGFSAARGYTLHAHARELAGCFQNGNTIHAHTRELAGVCPKLGIPNKSAYARMHVKPENKVENIDLVEPYLHARTRSAARKKPILDSCP